MSDEDICCWLPGPRQLRRCCSLSRLCPPVAAVQNCIFSDLSSHLSHAGASQASLAAYKNTSPSSS